MEDGHFNLEFEEAIPQGADFNELLHRPKYGGVEMTGDTDIPIVPTKTSDLENDSGFLSSIDYNEATNKPTIENVTLEGNVTASQLGLATETALEAETTAREQAIGVVEGNIDTLTTAVSEHDTSIQNLENDVDTLQSDVEALEGEVNSIEDVIPAQATISNQLADKDFVNSSLNSITAFYNTKDAEGTQFATKADLDATTTFYSGGEVRVPTRNDYCIVLADETKTDPVTGENPTTRYIYQTNGWEFQYIVNKTTLTAAQLATLNSGFVAADRTKLNGIEAGAQKNVQSNWTQTSTSADDFIKNKPENLVQDANYVHTDNNYTTTEKNKLAGVESGAQVNVLEEVQINGADQTITGKKVNIPTATDSTFGVVKSSTNTFKVLTSAEYDALTTHDPNTLYLVRGE